MNSKSYMEEVHLLIDEEMSEYLTWMHDGASSHIAQEAVLDLVRHEMVPSPWPASSPDLPPIETIYFMTK
jgi:hypothetical protein